MDTRTDLASRVVMVDLTIRMWSGRKLDRHVTREVAHNHNADATKIGNFNKLLIAEEPLKAVQKAANAGRAAHYARTVAWSDTGTRLLALTGFAEYERYMIGAADDFDDATRRLFKAWSDLLQEARGRLTGGLFDINDYPDLEELKSRYEFRVNMQPMYMNGHDVRLDMGKEQEKMLRESIRATEERRIRTIEEDLRDRVITACTAMSKKMREYKQGKSRVYNSLVDNIRDLVALLPTLNVLNDPKIEDARRALQRDLATFDIDDLKTSKAARTDAQKKADRIVEMLS